ncbi:MAG: hypothetical protein GC193_11895 [Cryomorphaceae bacterium]|nr:hypothetical protein [Cryomorphaceae bacterium]
MEKKIDLDFACDQKWDEMTHLDKSTRFCLHCSKKVVDYAGTNLSEIKSECGRFSLNQVNTLRRQFTYRNLNPVAMSVLAVLGLTVVSNEMHGQVSAQQTWQTQQQIGKIQLTGMVKDKETNQLLPFTKVEVVLGDSLISKAITDEEGKFSVEIAEHKSKLEDLKIVFSRVGYQNDSIQSVILPHELLDKEVVVDIEAMLELEPIEIVGKKPQHEKYMTSGLIKISPEKRVLSEDEKTPDKK